MFVVKLLFIMSCACLLFGLIAPFRAQSFEDNMIHLETMYKDKNEAERNSAIHFHMIDVISDQMEKYKNIDFDTIWFDNGYNFLSCNSDMYNDFVVALKKLFRDRKRALVKISFMFICFYNTYVILGECEGSMCQKKVCDDC